MKKIKKILAYTILLAAFTSPAFAAEGQTSSTEKAKVECVCKSDKDKSDKALNCVTINTRNRYDEEGARKRRMYPRFMHSKIKQSIKCKCECHSKK